MTPQSPATEIADARYAGLDTWRDEDILTALFEGQQRALASVEAAIPQLARAARAAAEKLATGGRLVYLAAGSPALISLGDALEIPQTYGVRRDRIALIFAGGEAITRHLTGVDEDDADQARREVAAAGISEADCVLAISASGSTPFTVAGLQAARQRRAFTVAMAGNRGAPLLDLADIAVLLDAGPEVISGSTRMGAGTAQKAALNMLSTLIGVHLGHVYDGLMVNVMADNEKLRGRAARIVMRITGADQARALDALAQSGGAVKPAVLIAAGVRTPEEAEQLLGQTKGNLRAALALIGSATPALN